MVKKIKTLPQFKTSTFISYNNNKSFDNYVKTVYSYPVLTKEEEYNLAIKWLRDKDKKAGETLILTHLRLVVSFAYSLKNYGLAIQELVTSGNLGLMKALYKFEPDKGFRFSTYASFWIKAEMYETILSNCSISKISNSSNQKKVFFNLNKAKKALGILDNVINEEQVKQIASYLNVQESDVNTVSNRLSYPDKSLNISQNNDDESLDILSNISDDTINIEESFEKQELKKISNSLLYKNLAKLTEREQDIIKQRFLVETPLTLEDLSIKYKISKERVRQIQEKSLQKLKDLILNDKSSKDIF